jgi:hypothetical protein
MTWSAAEGITSAARTSARTGPLRIEGDDPMDPAKCLQGLRNGIGPVFLDGEAESQHASLTPP